MPHLNYAVHGFALLFLIFHCKIFEMIFSLVLHEPVGLKPYVMFSMEDTSLSLVCFVEFIVSLKSCFVNLFFEKYSLVLVITDL